MHSAHVLGATVALLVCVPLAHAGEGPFEGKITLRLRDSVPQGATYSIRDARARIDIPSPGGVRDRHVVVNLARGEEPRPAVELRRTGHFRTVVGQRCEDWRLRNGDDFVEACVVAGVGWYDPRRLAGQAIPAWSQMLELDRAFPVSVTELRDGRVTFAMWATDVERESLDDDVFVLPPPGSHRSPS